VDDYGGEAYLPMVSDWDLSAAFLSASDPGTILQSFELFIVTQRLTSILLVLSLN